MDKTPKSTRTDEQVILEQAAHWHLLMQGAAGPDERAAFDEWLMDSRRHVRNFLLVAALDRELTRIDPERQIAIDDLRARTQEDVIQLQAHLTSGNASPASSRGSSPSSNVERGGRRFHRFLGIAAAAVALLLTVAVWRWEYDGRYSTAVGEQRIVRLTDGSVMYLNTHSRAKVEYSQQARSIHLVKGEALFVVARDAARPFRVETGTAVIQAVGTEFNVYRRDADTAVAVLEGRVQVFTGDGAGIAPDASRAQRAREPVQLSTGEEASVRHDGQIAKREAVDVSKAVAWRDRRLIFRESTLGDIVHEFNRYNLTPQLRIEGAGAAARRYSGIFDAYDPESLVQVLSADGDLVLGRTEDKVVIRHRAAGD